MIRLGWMLSVTAIALLGPAVIEDCESDDIADWLRNICYIHFLATYLSIGLIMAGPCILLCGLYVYFTERRSKL